MGATPQRPIHLLEIPLARFPLLVPSATVAEVINPAAMAPLPLTPPWVLGVLGWRGQGLAVVSFEALLAGQVPPAGQRSKIIVFYPPPGATTYGFVGIVSLREPQPHVVREASELVGSAAGAVDSPYVAATVRIKDRTLLIPNLDALARTFYP